MLDLNSISKQVHKVIKDNISTHGRGVSERNRYLPFIAKLRAGSIYTNEDQLTISNENLGFLYSVTSFIEYNIKKENLLGKTTFENNIVKLRKDIEKYAQENNLKIIADLKKYHEILKIYYDVIIPLILETFVDSLMTIATGIVKKESKNLFIKDVSQFIEKFYQALPDRVQHYYLTYACFEPKDLKYHDFATELTNVLKPFIEENELSKSNSKVRIVYKNWRQIFANFSRLIQPVTFNISGKSELSGITIFFEQKCLDIISLSKNLTALFTDNRAALKLFDKSIHNVNSGLTELKNREVFQSTIKVNQVMENFADYYNKGFFTSAKRKLIAKEILDCIVNKKQEVSLENANGAQLSEPKRLDDKDQDVSINSQFETIRVELATKKKEVEQADLKRNRLSRFFRPQTELAKLIENAENALIPKARL